MRRACLLPAFCSMLLGQVTTTTGALQGLVEDTSGSPIAAARIHLRRGSATDLRTAATDGNGRFVISGLPIGEYNLLVESPGFRSVSVEPLLVSVGQTTFERVKMALQEVVEKIDVREQSEAIQPAATTASVALGYDRIEEAPSQNRNYLSFVFTAPGVSASPGANTGRSAAGTRNVANDSGFVFNGMRGRNNSTLIDGADNRDETTGGGRVAIGLEMVQEFKVASTSASAELGGAAGGLLNVVTRSGDNMWHGDTTYFMQNEVLNARSPEAQTTQRPRMRRYQPGASLMGPIRRDRTFFATAVEGAWESSDEWSEVSSTAESAINRMLASPAYAGAPVRAIYRGLFDAGARDLEASFKLNHQLTPANSLMARVAYSNGLVRNDVQAVDNFSDRTARGTSLIRDDSFVAGWTGSAGPAFVNDLRGQISRRTGRITPSSYGPMFEIPGVLTFGQAYRADSDRTEDHYELVESATWVRGKHMLTGGASLHRISLDSRLANRFSGLYVFPTLADFLAARPDVFIQAFGDPRTNFSTTPAGFWAQDRWTLRPGLSIEAGLRYDRQAMPAGIAVSSRNVAPRFGLAWHPSGGSPWVLRASAGLFYDRFPLAYLNEAIQKNGTLAFEQYATGVSAVAALAASRGGAIAEPLPGITRSFYSAAGSFPSTYSRKFTLGLERRLDSQTSVTLELSDVRGFHLPRVRNAALGLPPQFQLEQTGNSQYRGATVFVNRRMSRELSYLVSYTLSQTNDDASDYDEQPLSPSNIRLDWARSRQHQTHRFTASALLGVWQEITVAPAYQFGSGRPVNALETTDLYRTGAYPISARPLGIGRNPFLGPATQNLDLRIFKTIPIREGRAKIILGGECFNLLNHTNPLKVSAFYAVSGMRLGNYGEPVETTNARQIQLVYSIEF